MVTSADVQKKFQDAWGSTGPTTVGLTVTEMVNGLEEGKVRALYVMGENPMLSDPDLNHARHCLEKAEFLVVQDIFLTETAQLAHVVLPGVSFAEKDGTFTDTERRVQRVRKAIEPVGECAPGLGDRLPGGASRWAARASTSPPPRRSWRRSRA